MRTVSLEKCGTNAERMICAHPECMGFREAISVRDGGFVSEIVVELIEVVSISDDPARIPRIDVYTKKDSRTAPPAGIHH